MRGSPWSVRRPVSKYRAACVVLSLAATIAAGCGSETDPDSAALQLALRTGGVAEIRTADGARRAVRRAGDPLPEGMFHVVKLGWRSYPGDHFAEVTDEGISQLAKLQQLEELDLSGTAITDAGLEALAPLANLARLHLNDTAISDAAIPTLERMAGLRELRLGGSKITRDGLLRLRRALRNCQIRS